MFELQKVIESFFNISSDTAATLIITFLVFGLGVLISLTLDYIKAAMRRRLHRRITLLNVNGFKKEIEKQQKNYAAFNVQLFYHNNPFVLLKSDLTKIQNFMSVGYEQAFQAFFFGLENSFRRTDFRLKAFNKLWEIIEALRFWHQNSIDDFEKFLSSWKDVIYETNSCLEAIYKIIFQLNHDFKNGLIRDPRLRRYVEEVFVVYRNWLDTPDHLYPDTIHLNLVLPLMNLNRRHPDLIIVLDMRHHLTQASYCCKRLDKLLTDNKSQFFMYQVFFKCEARLLVIIRRALA